MFLEDLFDVLPLFIGYQHNIVSHILIEENLSHSTQNTPLDSPCLLYQEVFLCNFFASTPSHSPGPRSHFKNNYF